MRGGKVDVIKRGHWAAGEGRCTDEGFGVCPIHAWYLRVKTQKQESIACKLQGRGGRDTGY
jgi:hypothetical protein